MSQPRIVLPYPNLLPQSREQLAKVFRQVGDGGTTAEPAVPAGSDRDPGDFADHDAFFRVLRVHRPEHIVTALCTAEGDVLEHWAEDARHAGHTHAPPGELSQGGRLLAELAGAPTGGAWPDGPVPAHEAFPQDCVSHFDHWQVGHRLFFCLIDVLVVALHCYSRAVRDERADQADHALRIVVDICRSSAVAMSYTGGFPPKEYENVRAAMMAAKPGISGLHNLDHRELVRVLRKNAQHIRKVGARQQGVLRNGLALLYSSHGDVCELFGGGESPSLLMQQLEKMDAPTTKTQDLSPGTQVAAKLAQRRLALIPDSKKENR